ncbi:exonuclease domain-containing protein [Ureibacillus suwonensis]|uniref:Exonuclease domain-containing protein n=1 Tax=Ureibacillus suwonensis TaxID=313007 RepID=A0ABW0R7M0_9BACL
MRKETYIFLDIEAALVRGKQHIIEIGAVKWLPNDEVEFFSELIQPYKLKKLSNKIQQLTGIQTEDLLSAPSFKQVINRFKEWCQGNAIFVTFGEFDRKILEEELFRNRIQRRFIYPMVDFQQKYMIENQIKVQPSLNELMEKFDIVSVQQHRALDDAKTLFQIFKSVDGHKVIERQKTNQFAVYLSEVHHGENAAEVYLTYITGEIFPSKIHIHSMDTIHKSLSYIKKEREFVQEDGSVIKTDYVEVLPNAELAEYLRKVAEDIENKVLITRSGLKQISRINRLHQCVMPKTEVMTLQNLLMDAEALSQFTINGQPLDTYEKSLCKLLFRYKHRLIKEFKRRNLFAREGVKV